MKHLLLLLTLVFVACRKNDPEPAPTATAPSIQFSLTDSTSGAHFNTALSGFVFYLPAGAPAPKRSDFLDESRGSFRALQDDQFRVTNDVVVNGFDGKPGGFTRTFRPGKRLVVFWLLEEANPRAPNQYNLLFHDYGVPRLGPSVIKITVEKAKAGL